MFHKTKADKPSKSNKLGAPIFDLRKVPAAVINIPRETARREHIKSSFDEIGINYQFIDGVLGVGKIRGCARSHAAAFDAVPSAPFMVFEDDVEMVWENPVLPHLPDGADVIYLGTNTGGCFPNSTENKSLFGHRSLHDFALASEHDEVYLQLHSMVSAHAILFLNSEAKAVYREQLRIADKRKTPLDVRYAYLMPKFRVFALRRPMFVEAQKFQPKGQMSVERPDVTRIPLKATKPGEIREGNKRGKRVAARAVETANGNLEWSIISIKPIES